MSLPENATVKIYFHGLLVFCFDEARQYCHIGVHSTAADHHFRVIIKKITPGGGSMTVTEIIGGEDIFVDVGNVSTEGVSTYETAAFDKDVILKNMEAADPFITLGGIDDQNDFRWIMDLEGKDFHNIKLDPKPGVLSPKLHINNGIFYTAKTTPGPFLAKKGAASPKYIGKVGFIMGANIYLDEDDSQIVLRIGNGQLLRFRKGDEPDATYKIAFVNNPPPSTFEPGDHDDLQFYYQALILPAGEEKFSLTPADVTALPLPSGRFPCGCAYLSRTHSL